MTTYKLNPIDYLTRATKAAFCSVLITFALLAAMQHLIQHDYVYVPKTTTPMPPVVLPKEQKIDVIVDDVKPPEPVDPPPTAAPTQEKFAVGPTREAILIPTVAVIRGKPTLTALPPGEPIPYLRPSPIYPRGPQAKGIGGYVDLMFTINATGATENVQVIGAEPATIFNRAAVKAVQKWKYRPQIADSGEAVRKVGVTTRVRFQIAE